LKGKEEGQSALDIPEVGKADFGGAAHTVNRSRTGSSDAQLLLFWRFGNDTNLACFSF